MKFEEKLAAATGLLESTGIWRINFAPPLVRLLWLIGVKVPPPHFIGFAANFLFAAGFFGVAWGLLMWFLLWSRQTIPPTTAFGFSALAGLLFGLCMAGYYRYGARKHAIPLWKEFQPAHESSRT